MTMIVFTFCRSLCLSLFLDCFDRSIVCLKADDCNKSVPLFHYILRLTQGFALA